MKGINRAYLIGHLCEIPELRTGPNGLSSLTVEDIKEDPQDPAGG